MSTERKPELLIPASSLEVLKTAVVFGADAVYIGGGGLWSARQSQKFFRRGYDRRHCLLPMSMV